MAQPHREVLIPLLQARFRERPAHEWETLLQGASTRTRCCTPTWGTARRRSSACGQRKQSSGIEEDHMRAVKVLLWDFARAFYAPRALYTELRAGRRSPSWVCVLVYCLIYMAGTLWLHLHGFEPFTAPWLVLDPKVYYLVETFYLTPVVFLAWILGAGIIQVLGRLFGGQGSFEGTLHMTGYSLWAPWYPLIIMDIIQTAPEWIYNTVLAACMVLIVVGTTIAVRIEQRISVPAALATAIVTFGSVGVMLFTYIR